MQRNFRNGSERVEIDLLPGWSERINAARCRANTNDDIFRFEKLDAELLDIQPFRIGTLGGPVRTRDHTRYDTSFARDANSPSTLSISAWLLAIEAASSSCDISESAFRCDDVSLRVGAMWPCPVQHLDRKAGGDPDGLCSVRLATTGRPTSTHLGCAISTPSDAHAVAGRSLPTRIKFLSPPSESKEQTGRRPLARETPSVVADCTIGDNVRATFSRGLKS